MIVARFCEPSSELHIAEHFYKNSALADLLGIPANKIYDNRLYRALDHLLPHKDKLQQHLKERFGELFHINYDLMLYDVTSTYFDGEAAANPTAQRGYSRDHRSDCKQVCIALVVTKEGIPLGYEIFAGNKHDSKTVEDIITRMEKLYGKADRIWIMDRGMISPKTLTLLNQEQRRYILGMPKSQLKHFADELEQEGWQTIREGLEVKLCSSSLGHEDEVFILCRSPRERPKKKPFMIVFSNVSKRNCASCKRAATLVGFPASNLPNVALVVCWSAINAPPHFLRSPSATTMAWCKLVGHGVSRKKLGHKSAKVVMCCAAMSKTGQPSSCGKRTFN